MMYDSDNYPRLPDSWLTIKVSEAFEAVSNANKKLKNRDALPDGKYPVIDQGVQEISGFSNDNNLVVHASEDMPVVLFGDHTRILKCITKDFVPGADGTKLLKPNLLWNNRFAFEMLRAIKLPDRGYARHYQYLRDSYLPLPPLREQQRISEKLNALLSQMDAIHERLDRIPKVLNQFRNSVIAAAINGKLTEAWRSKPDEAYLDIEIVEPYAHFVSGPSSWNQKKLDDVCDFIGGSQPPKSTFVSNESKDVVRLIQIRDYKSDKFKVFIPRKLGRKFCTKADIMIGRYGPPIFQILRGLEGAYNVALMKAKPKIPDLYNEYLYYWLKGDVLLKYVESGSDRTAGQDGVRKELLYPYPFFLPPLEEQKEIVRRVEQLFSFADKIEARYTIARAQVDKLTPALLAKAFRGELVEQDPDDEPANELLARIKKNKSTTTSTKMSPGKKAAKRK